MATLETPRLVLRRWREEDIAPLAVINGDADVMRWIGTGTVRDLRQTRASVEAWEREWDATGLGLFAVEIRETGQLAGLTGLAVPHFLPEIMPAIEVAWRFGKPHWGQGIATEAARAALEFGLLDRGLAKIVAIVQIGNGASERVMQKISMHVERETTDPASGRPVRVYEIGRSEYPGAGRAADVLRRDQRPADLELDLSVRVQRDVARVAQVHPAVVDRHDVALHRAERPRAERLTPLVEEVAEREDPAHRRLDVNDAVGRVSVQPVQAAPAGGDGTLR